MTAPLLEATDVTVGYDTAAGRVTAVDHVTLSIMRGETLGLVGESGCGKSSLGRALLRLLPMEGGTVRYDGVDLATLKPAELKKLRPKLQPVFQDPIAALDPRMTVADTLAEALSVRGAATKAERTRQIEALLTTIGLPIDSGARRPHGFSAGQRQRICIARALAVEPEFLVLDEPVSALDVSVQAQIINLLVDLQRTRRLTYLFISHDLGVVSHLATRVAVMYAGRLVELGPTEAVLTRPMHPYTRALMAALEVSGEPPSPLRRPPGCAFHPRCPLAIDACRKEVPPLVQVGPDHLAACPPFTLSVSKGDVRAPHPSTSSG